VIASAIPPTMPIIIDSAVRISVLRSPFRTGGENRYSPTMCHRKLSLVSTVLTNIAASTASTATASHRPGWRTGTASIGFGRRCSCSTGGEATASAPDLRGRDGAVAHVPLLEGRRVGAGVHQRLQGRPGRRGERALVHRRPHAVRRGLVGAGRPR